MPWWVNLGYPPFDEGRDGFPRTGQVIKHYRRQKKDEKNKMWTQSALAHVLGIQKQAVIKIENHDADLDNERRKFLCGVLGIPPLLLSVRTLEEALQEATKNGTVPNPATTGLGTSGAIDIEEHHNYLTTAKEQHRLAGTAGLLENSMLRMDAIYRELPHVGKQDRVQLHSLLFEYHLLAAAVLSVKPQQLSSAAFRQIDKGSRFASSPELKTVCLLSKGDILKEIECPKEALEAFGMGEAYRKNVPAHLNGIRLLYLGALTASVAQDQSDKRTALSFIEQAGNMIRSLSSPLFVYGFDYSPQKYHLRKAETLIYLGQNRDALDELADIQCNPVGWWQIQQNLLEAQAYMNLGNYPLAVSYTEASLSTIKAFGSDFIVHVQAIYRQLCDSSYRNSPDVARLGYLLKG